VLCTCVNAISEFAPKERTEASVISLTSSPKTASRTTDKPPSVCNEPSVVEVALVVSSVLIIPLAVTVTASKPATSVRSCNR